MFARSTGAFSGNKDTVVEFSSFSGERTSADDLVFFFQIRRYGSCELKVMKTICFNT